MALDHFSSSLKKGSIACRATIDDWNGGHHHRMYDNMDKKKSEKKKKVKNCQNSSVAATTALWVTKVPFLSFDSFESDPPTSWKWCWQFKVTTGVPFWRFWFFPLVRDWLKLAGNLRLFPYLSADIRKSGWDLRDVGPGKNLRGRHPLWHAFFFGEGMCLWGLKNPVV